MSWKSHFWLYLSYSALEDAKSLKSYILDNAKTFKITVQRQ